MDNFLTGYIYKYGFFYVGWIFERKKEKGISYFDNNPIYNFYDETGIKYLCFSLTKKATFKKFEKFSRKLAEKSEAEAPPISR